MVILRLWLPGLRLTRQQTLSPQCYRQTHLLSPIPLSKLPAYLPRPSVLASEPQEHFCGGGQRKREEGQGGVGHMWKGRPPCDSHACTDYAAL